MTIVLNVTLLSGRSFSIAASPESKIQELRWQVQKDLVFANQEMVYFPKLGESPNLVNMF